MKLLQRAHPFLIAVYAILYPAAKNWAQVEALSVIRLVVLALVGTAVVAAVVWAMFRDWTRAALVTSVLVLAFFNFGHLFDLLWSTGVFESMAVLQTALALLAGLIVVWAAIRLRRARGDLGALSSFAGLFSALLVVFACFGFVRAGLAERVGGDQTEPMPESLAGSEALAPVPPILEDRADLPDIYFFVFDGYARADTLLWVYGHDNSPFLERLAERGFYVADRSWSNYSMTLLSLAATLNMRQVDDIAAEQLKRNGSEASARAPFRKLIRRPEVAQFLKALGYRYVTFATSWSGTSSSDVADEVYDFAPFFGPFEDSLVRTTALRSLAPSVADAHRFTLDKVKEIPHIDGPTFAFVHVLMPHNPYVFDRHGNVRVNIPMRMHWQVRTGGWKEQQAYIDQMVYLNGRIEEIVDEILEASPVEPIILLQGDHGSAASAHHRRMLAERPSGAYGPGSPLPSERMSILNAFYVPETVRQRLYPDVTAVNTFRLLFSTLFDADYPLLEDRVYFSWYRRPFRLWDVTEELQVSGSSR